MLCKTFCENCYYRSTDESGLIVICAAMMDNITDQEYDENSLENCDYYINTNEIYE